MGFDISYMAMILPVAQHDDEAASHFSNYWKRELTISLSRGWVEGEDCKYGILVTLEEKRGGEGRRPHGAISKPRSRNDPPTLPFETGQR